MPRFFIHIRNGDGLQRDEQGQDFQSARAASAEASKTAGELLADETMAGNTHAIELTIEDQDGAQVSVIRASISFSDKIG